MGVCRGGGHRNLSKLGHITRQLKIFLAKYKASYGAKSIFVIVLLQNHKYNSLRVPNIFQSSRPFKSSYELILDLFRISKNSQNTNETPTVDDKSENIQRHPQRDTTR
jgi:hypothetical protein